MRYRVFATLAQDIDAGFIWVGRPTLPSRTVIRVHCIDTGRAVYCESLPIDNNYLKRYNQPPRYTINESDTALVMSTWYRNCLGINMQAGREFNFDIKPANRICGRIKASLKHPNNAIRLATILAIISVSLGFLGATLGIISLTVK